MCRGWLRRWQGSNKVIGASTGDCHTALGTDAGDLFTFGLITPPSVNPINLPAKAVTNRFGDLW